MATVHFTPALKRFRPDITSFEVSVDTVSGVIDSIEERYPGLSDYIVEENRVLRDNVNIFINDTFIRDRKGLTDKVGPEDEVHIIQALSGG